MLFNLLYRLVIREDATNAEIGQSPLHVLPPFVLILLAFGCLLLAACVAGLTLGLMGLNTTSLEIVTQSDDPQEAAAAKVIKPVREQGNLLLVTLLFANTIATELLPLVLEALVPGGYFSLIVSVVSIMLFGEIIPQAICSRHPLVIGSKLIGFVKVLRTILYPVSAPIAYVLDVFLGDELATVYNRGELKGLIDVHAVNGVVTHDETVILKGALDFSEKAVSQILTPAKNVFMLDIDTKLDRKHMLKILRNGHSRIPIYDGNHHNIVCLLLVKQLILVNPLDELPIRSLISNKKRTHKVRVAPALECEQNTPIADLLNEFQKGRSHMAVVYDSLAKPTEEREFVGIVSIEDIIEEILQEEIVDETDMYVDNTNQAKVLVRNTEGKLVRTTNVVTSAVRVAGTGTTILLKELDVPTLRAPLNESKPGNRYRPDWKKKKDISKLSDPEYIGVPSVSQPLLSNDILSDMELGEVQSGYATDSAIDAIPTPQRPEASLESSTIEESLSLAGMQYVNLPEQPTASFYGEDDPILPEDFAKKSIVQVSTTTTIVPQTSPGESSKKLYLRPLPEYASDQRFVNIPRRHPFATGGNVTNPVIEQDSGSALASGQTPTSQPQNPQEKDSDVMTEDNDEMAKSASAESSKAT